MPVDLDTLIRISLYFFELVMFVIITRKCFFEKYSVIKVFGSVLFSPVAAIFLSNVMALHIFDDFSQNSSESIILYSITFTVFQTVVQILALAAYVWFVKAQNPSIALFVYLCYSLMVPNLYYVALLERPLIVYLVQAALVILFYVVLIRPVSKMTRERIATNMRLFVLLPALSMIYNAIIFVRMMIIFFHITLGSEDIRFIKDLIMRATDDEATINVAYDKLREIVFLSLGNSIDTLYYTVLFVILILIIAFAVIAKNIEYLNEVMKAKDELHELNREVMEALAHTIDAKDEYTKGHSTRVAKYARMIAERMGLDEEQCENVYYMGLLHDIGKIAVPNEIINKKSKLTDEEYGIVKVHTEKGYEILAEIKSRPNLACGAEYHHERVDGKGYPRQIKGDEIPIEARIIAVADSYDAMTSNRSYRNYLPQEKVRAELLRNIGTQFDEIPAKCMVKIIDEDKDYQLHE